MVSLKRIISIQMYSWGGGQMSESIPVKMGAFEEQWKV